MNRTGLLCVGLLAASMLSSGREKREDLPVREIVFLSGASCIEELDETELERYAQYQEHPVRLNTASLSRLQASGLFSRFQAASIVDYRSRSGDILSAPELAFLDGFDTEYAEALRPFVSFDSQVSPGHSSSEHRLSLDAQTRLCVKTDQDGARYSYGAKFGAEVGNLFSVRATAKSSLTPTVVKPDKYAGSLAYFGKGHIGKIVVGDYNVRFGQGLMLWSGFTMSGFSNPSAFCRHASGISQSSSYTSYQRGVALDAIFSHITLSAAASADLLPALNINWMGKNITLGATSMLDGRGGLYAGCDGIFTFGGFHSFYELCYDCKDRCLAFLCGAEWRWAYDAKVSLLVRNYPDAYSAPNGGAMRTGSVASDERGVALGLRSGRFYLSLDAAEFPKRGKWQLKAVSTMQLDVNEEFSVLLRANAQYKYPDNPRCKLGFRADADWEFPIWAYHIRTNLQYCQSFAWLAYAEAGCRGGCLACYVRATSFHADSWNDRIYVYERDAPGNFNLPAYYGRGVAATLYCRSKWSRHKIYLGVSISRRLEDNRGKVDIRFQYNVILKDRRHDK